MNEGNESMSALTLTWRVGLSLAVFYVCSVFQRRGSCLVSSVCPGVRVSPQRGIRDSLCHLPDTLVAKTPSERQL